MNQQNTHMILVGGQIQKQIRITNFKIIFSIKQLAQPTEFGNGNSTVLGKMTLYATSRVKLQLYPTNWLFFIVNHLRNILKVRGWTFAPCRSDYIYWIFRRFFLFPWLYIGYKPCRLIVGTALGLFKLKSCSFWKRRRFDQLSVGLLAQLVERCTGIAEVMGSNPVRAWIFSGPIYNYSFQ